MSESTYTYDAGALLAAEKGNRSVWALHAWAVARGYRPIIPAAVLAQAWRGGPQAQLSRLLRSCEVEELTEARAREAGTACALAHTSDIVDASVVVGALAREDTVVTTDPDDMIRLADALGREIQVVRL